MISWNRINPNEDEVFIIHGLHALFYWGPLWIAQLLYKFLFVSYNKLKIFVETITLSTECFKTLSKTQILNNSLNSNAVCILYDR